MRHSAVRVLTLSTVFLAGCGGTSVHMVPTNPPPRALAPRTPESVEVFTSRAPERPYSHVAYLEVQENDRYTNAQAERLMRELRTAAAKAGCDGVVVSGEIERKVPGFWGVHEVKVLRSTCIVFAPREMASTWR